MIPLSMTLIGSWLGFQGRDIFRQRAGCSKAEPKNFRPVADPLPGGAGPPKFKQLEMVTTWTYRPSLVKIDAHNFELSW